MLTKKTTFQRKRRSGRVRFKLKNNHSSAIRFSVFRSLNNISVQAIDDKQQKTLFAASSLQLKDFAGDKTAQAQEVGKLFAEKALQAGISKGTLDRGRFLYHGRVKALADGMRAAGMQI